MNRIESVFSGVMIRKKGCAMSEVVLRLSGVTFSYDRHPVLEGIDLEVAAGEFLGLIGPNGSGKSTLVRLALGRLSPDAGRVYLFGEPVEKFRKWHRIGYVSQKSNSFNLGFPATVYEVVASGLTGKLGLFRRIGAKERALIRETLERLGLSDIAGANIGRLSGGQQQRDLHRPGAGEPSRPVDSGRTDGGGRCGIGEAVLSSARSASPGGGD